MATHWISWEKRMCKKGDGRVSKTKMLANSVPTTYHEKENDTQKKRAHFKRKYAPYSFLKHVRLAKNKILCIRGPPNTLKLVHEDFRI
jgi:hypothetical protein